MAKDFAGSMSWANSAAAGTAQTVEDTDTSHTGSVGIVHVHNPSTETALTVQPQLRWTDGGGTEHDSNLGAAFGVPVGATVAQRVEGLGIGHPVIRATNDTAVGLAGAFTAQVRVEFLG